MADKQDIGEISAYILFTGFTVLLFPIAGPVIMYSNWNGYAEKFDRVPGINPKGGAINGAVSFVYVLCVVAVVGVVAVALTSGVSGFTSPVEPRAADRGSGPTPSSSSPDTPTGNLVERGTDTPSSPTEAERRAERQRYKQFGESLAEDAEEEGVSVTGVSANASTDTLVIEFQTSEGEAVESVRQDQRVLLTLYADRVGGLDSPNPEYDINDIPLTVKIVGVTTEGDPVNRGEMLFAWAYEYAVGNIDQDEYERRFYTDVEEVSE
jgi:hypothetical protein